MNLSIKARVLLITMPLVLSLIVFAVTAINDAQKTIRNSETIVSASAFLAKANALLHELQKERGASAGFMAGGDFRAILDKQRTLTDQKLTDFTAYANSHAFTSLPDNLQQVYQGVMEQMSQRSSIQARIDQKNIPPAQAIGYYTGMNATLLNLLPEISIVNSEADLSHVLTGLHNYLEMKERAGIERAIISGALSRQAVTDASLVRIASLIAAQDSFYGLFKQYMHSDPIESITQSLEGNKLTAVQAVRNQVLQRETSTPSTQWFQLATERINAMKQGEDALTELLNSKAGVIAAKAQDKHSWTLLTVIPLLVVVCGAVIVISRSLNRLEKGLAEIANKIDHTAQSHNLMLRVNYNGKDEVGQVSRAFNQMMDDFVVLIRNIESASGQLASSAGQTAETTKENVHTTQSQLNQTREVSTDIKEMTATISDVNQQITQVGELIKQVKKESESAEQSVMDSVSSIRTVNDEVQSVSEEISALIDSSEKITEVISVISTIAEQTNLLALNAAIEAARAGEQGRGFAVVADEVRGLAQRTQDSVGEIENMVVHLQSNVRRAADAIKQSQDRVAVSVQHAGEVSNSLQAIFTSIEDVQIRAVQISTAAEQQMVFSENIADNAVQMTDHAETGADHSQQLASVSDELSRLARDMRQNTAVFQVSM